MGGVIKEFAVTQRPTLLAPGPNGSVWFAAENPASVNLINGDGRISQVIVLPIGTQVGGVATTPDGGLWFTTYVVNNGRMAEARIQHVLADGTVRQYRTPGDIAAFSVASDRNGAAWFTQQQDRIGRIDAEGNVTAYPLPELPGGKYNAAKAIASDGNDMWVTTMNDPAVIRIRPNGTMERHPVNWAGAKPRAISAGTDGVWFSDVSASGSLGHIDREGVMHKIAIPRELTEAPFGVTQAKDGIWMVGLAYVAKMGADGEITKLRRGFGQSIAATVDGKVWVSANITNFGANYYRKPFVGAIWQFEEK
jgi:virginiamycin B lyase